MRVIRSSPGAGQRHPSNNCWLEPAANRRRYGRRQHSDAPKELPAPRSGVESPAAIPAALPSPRAATPTRADWPGFRGLHRDGIVTGLRIKTDWTSSPPVELWRRPVGPGWSSFAVRDGLLYTQEQRGDFEVVACYSATNGEPVWTHRDAARFWESNGGAGPRATPTLRDGRVYTLGATGVLNALDAGSGAVVWTRNAASDTGAKVPGWGFSGSPLVVDDVVIVATAGRLAAYDLATGDPRWRPLGGRRQLQFPATVDRRRSRAGPAVERRRRHQRRASGRQRALDALVAGLHHPAASPVRGRRRLDRHRQRRRRNGHAPPRGRARADWMDRPRRSGRRSD